MSSAIAGFTLEIAQRLAGFGFSVIPITHKTDPKGKQPVCKWKQFQERAATPAELIKWFSGTDHQGAIVTGAVSGVAVVDTDSPAAQDWANANLPETPLRVRTSRGEHLYFRHPGIPVSNKGQIKTSDGQIALDVRGDGGYVLAPWSLHPSGSTYEAIGWEIFDEGGSGWAGVPVFDPAWIELTPTAPQPSAGPPSGFTGDAYRRAEAWMKHRDPAIEGQGGDNWTYITVCELIGFGLSDDQILELLLAWNGSCQPPWTERELVAKIASARKSATGTPGEKLNSGNQHRSNGRSAPNIQEDASAGPPSGPTSEPSTDAEPWPSLMAPEARHGLVGEVVNAIEPHTEADPNAVLAQFVLAFGHLIGRGPYWQVDETRHFTNLFLVIVGTTNSGRKGLGWDLVLALIIRALKVLDDATFLGVNEVLGLGSGEAVLDEIRDRDRPSADSEELEESLAEAAERKRILIQDSEFSAFLKVVNRDGSTLGPNIRKLWDGSAAGNRTKAGGKVRCTGHHVSCCAHSTPKGLRADLRSAEAGGGTGNRFLFVLSRRSKILPFGGKLNQAEMDRLASKIASAISWARAVGEREISMDAGASAVWVAVYGPLTEGLPGLLGEMAARGAPQCRRLALVYAMTDKSPIVRVQHLLAALAFWDYVLESECVLWGNRLGDETSDSIIEELRQKPDEGLTQAEISGLFGRHKPASVIAEALRGLKSAGFVSSTQELSENAKRPTTRWHLAPGGVSQFRPPFKFLELAKENIRRNPWIADPVVDEFHENHVWENPTASANGTSSNGAAHRASAFEVGVRNCGIPFEDVPLLDPVAAGRTAAREFIAELGARGMSVHLQSGHPIITPATAITPDDVAAVKRLRFDLVVHLEAEQSAAIQGVF